MFPGEFEHSLHSGLIKALTNHFERGTPSHQQAHSIHQNGFPRSGFTGDQIQPLPEFNFQTIDQSKILDGEELQHDKNLTS